MPLDQLELSLTPCAHCSVPQLSLKFTLKTVNPKHKTRSIRNCKLGADRHRPIANNPQFMLK